jgi:uncharacterized repeat protein (TIGR01451 family)
LYFAKWNGSAWTDASGSALTVANCKIVDNAFLPDIKMDKQGNPCIVYAASLGQALLDIGFQKWDGTQWVNAAGLVRTDANVNVSSTSDYSDEPSLALDGNDNPHIVWRDDTPVAGWNPEVCYTKWNGSIWTDASGAPLSLLNCVALPTMDQSRMPNVKVDSLGNAHIVWQEGLPYSDLIYGKWNGSVWVNAAGLPLTTTNGNVSNDPGESNWPILALDAFNRPNITWAGQYSGTNEHEVFFVKYTTNFEGTFTLTKGVEVNGNKLFDDHGKTVIPGTQLSYRIDWTANNPASDPLEQAYLYDQIPPGTKYVAGSATTNELSHSQDSGMTWISGEPPSNSLPGTRLRWGPFTTGWVGAAKSKYIGSNLPQPYDVNVTKSMMQSNEPVMVLDNLNRPHFAWTAFDFTNWQPDVFYCKWDGTQWVNAAGLPLTYANSKITDDFMFEQFPTLAVDDNGYANIAWTSQSTPYNRISFARWDGTQWVNADGTPFSYGGSAVTDATFNDNRASIDLDSQGRPCIAWYTDDFSSWKVRYAHWDGSGWKTADGSTLTASNGNIEPANPNYGYIPSLRINSQDNPCVAWQEYNISTNDDDVLYAYWNGSVWTGVDGSAYSFTNWSINKQAGTAYSASLALDSSDRPYIAFEYYTNWWDCDICFVRWDGANWSDASGATFVPGTNGYVANYPNMSIMPDVEVDGNDNPCLTWIDAGSGNDQAYFARWNGTAWVTADSQPINLTNPNVSSMPSHIYDPMLAIDSFGNPHMAWLGMASGNPEGPLDILYVNYLPAQRTVYFDVKVDNPFANPSLSPICNTATFNHRYNTGNAFESNEACVYIKSYEPKPVLTITKTARSFEYNVKDTFEFTIAVKNTGDAVASGVVVTDLFPKELEFISSMPSGSAGSSTIKFALGNLNPGMSEVFKLKFKLNGKIAVEDCVMLTNEAMATSGTIVVKDSAIFKVCAPKAPCPLYFDTIWTGLAKNIGKVNQAVTATITPKCGSSPYTVVIDWGDGTKSTGVLSKTNESFKAEHTYTSTGDFTIKVTVTDAYMATRITDKRIKIE